MALPININELLNGDTVEWARIDFKEGWQPLGVIQTICAFANDIDNLGGGYIIIGIKELEGRAMLPPIGIDLNVVDKIQKELMDLCHSKLHPNYFPIVEPVEFQGKRIIVIWAPGGSSRPYKAPDKYNSSNNNDYSYYIRHFSSTTKANECETRELVKMCARIPFDDEVNQRADIKDINISIIRQYLADVGSDLLQMVDKLSLEDLYRRMNIVDGPSENLYPKNIGLLMFNDDPTKFFPCAGIDIVEFNEIDPTRHFSEKKFRGPIHYQIREVLIYIKNHIIKEQIIKSPDIAESKRFFNYPFEALEEALVNTIYHRSYEDDSIIEIRVYPDKIEMISYPGPLPPLNKEKLNTGQITARKYRNRKI